MGAFAYHFKPKEMSGTQLIPLNRLREKLPEVFEQQIRKYDGRERLLQKTIPILNCLWNDVLHMSPINPQVILDTWRAEGLYDFASPPRKFEVYKIPVELLNEATTICFQSFNYDFDNYSPDLDKYWRFEKTAFSEQAIVDPKQLEIWQNDFKNQRHFFWYSHTMHILAQQEIDTRECEVFVCQ